MKIGSACKWLNQDGSSDLKATFRITTIRKLSSISPKERIPFLLEIVNHNLAAVKHQVELVSALPPSLRMWRIGSDLLPVYTHENAKEFYARADVNKLIDNHLIQVGKLARKNGVRLSFHPGQFVVIGSRNPGVRENGMRELEYHCDMFTRMGYKGWHPDGLAVNVHVGLKDPDVKAMRSLLKEAQTNVKNFVTLENDEFSWGAREIVNTFGDLVPLVLDVHHYWIHRGKRLLATASLVDDIEATWRGVRPKLHLAMSHPELCLNAKPTEPLSLVNLIAGGNTKTSLRAHSEQAWHTKSIDYAANFWPRFDIMWEGKNKNLGALQIAKHLKAK